MDRSTFYQAVCRAIREAVQGCKSDRERRKTEREAILQVLEDSALIQRTRGGAPISPRWRQSFPAWYRAGDTEERGAREMPQEPYRNGDSIDVSGNGLRFAIGYEPGEAPFSPPTFSAPSKGIANPLSPPLSYIAGSGSSSIELPPGVEIVEDSSEAHFDCAYTNTNGQTVNASFGTTDPGVLKDLKEAKKWNKDYGDRILIYWNDDPKTKDKTVTGVKHVTKTR